jgi:septum formation topological specificity factor MinE
VGVVVQRYFKIERGRRSLQLCQESVAMPVMNLNILIKEKLKRTFA